MRRLRFALSSLVLLALLPLARAHAQAPAPVHPAAPAATSTPADAADMLFREGNELANQRRLADAEQKYRAAWDIKKSYNIAGNLGLMEGEQGKWRDAAEHLWFALQYFPANGKPAQRARLDDMFKKAREHVGVLVFPAKVEGGQMQVNKQSIRLSPELQFRWFVEPGSVSIDVLHPLYRRTGKTLEIAKGKEVEVALDLVPMPERDVQPVQPAPAGAGQPQVKQSALQPQQPAPPDAKLPVRKIVIGAGIGASAILIGTGIALSVVSSQKGREAEELLLSLERADGPAPCPLGKNTSGCNNLYQLRDDQTTLGNAAIWTLISGGIIGGGTLVYALVKPKQSASSGLQVVPVASAGSAGLVVRGRW